MRDASVMPSLGSPQLQRRNPCPLSAASRGTQPRCIQAAGEGRNSSHREEESGKEAHSKAAGTPGSVEPSSVLHTAFLAGLSPRALQLLPFFQPWELARGQCRWNRGSSRAQLLPARAALELRGLLTPQGLWGQK